MDYLSKMEEILLIAIWQLKDNAYGYNLRKHILQVINKEFSYGNLYSALNQLEKKGYVIKFLGDPTESRRGKQKAFYSVTTAGKKALQESRETHELLWSNVSLPELNG
jgi:DNA-binding PadR family transcriptional regulator